MERQGHRDTDTDKDGGDKSECQKKTATGRRLAETQNTQERQGDTDKNPGKRREREKMVEVGKERNEDPPETDSDRDSEGETQGHRVEGKM